ncbi:hypothetical protein N7540_012955 [Penicillium herquei]|nr:hypothetical protein N7540_012955 [Penicillium herquei]
MVGHHDQSLTEWYERKPSPQRATRLVEGISMRAGKKKQPAGQFPTSLPPQPPGLLLRKRTLRGKAKPDEQQIRRRGGLSPQIVKSHDNFEALAKEVKSLKRELELMRSNSMDAGISEGR